MNYLINQFVSLENCPSSMTRAVQSLSDSFEQALSSGDFLSVRTLVACFEKAPDLLAAGIKVSMTLDALHEHLSPLIYERAMSGIDEAAAAIADCNGESSNKALNHLEELESAIAQDAYMGMMSSLL